MEEAADLGRAVAQAVSRWLRTAAAWIRVQIACGVCGGQSGIGQVSSEYFGFPCQSFHQFLHHHNHPGLTQLDSTPPLYKFKKKAAAFIFMSTLKIQTARSSELSVNIYQTTRRHVSDDVDLHHISIFRRFESYILRKLKLGLVITEN
jgi:hypothetical protein